VPPKALNRLLAQNFQHLRIVSCQRASLHVRTGNNLQRCGHVSNYLAPLLSYRMSPIPTHIIIIITPNCPAILSEIRILPGPLCPSAPPRVRANVMRNMHA